LACISGHHLRWATKKENEADKLLHGTILYGERNGSARLDKDSVRLIRQLAGVKKQRELAEQFGVAQTTISFVLREKTWNKL